MPGANALRTNHLVGVPRCHHIGDGSLAVDDAKTVVAEDAILVYPPQDKLSDDADYRTCGIQQFNTAEVRG